jgi:GntR family transcriptional repressor for pyruvate dehydrogenase complex
LSDSVIDAVKQMIDDYNFTPGDKFFSEKELTEKLQVSRSSIREAVRILEATGRVKVRHGKGIYIADSAPHNLEAFADWLKTNEQSILDLFEVRLIIEPEVAWKAAKKATDEDVANMERACDDFELYASLNNTEETIRHDRAFHKLLARATKNKTLFFLMKSMATSLPDGWISSLHTPGRIDKTMNEHGNILSAIKARDAERAANEMRTHLRNAVGDIKASMKD